MIRNLLFALTLALSTSAAGASDWQEFVALSEELHKMASDIQKSPGNAARDALLDASITRWATTAANLDTKSFNLLLFSLLETYHGTDPKERDWSELLIGRLDQAVRPKLEEQAQDADTATLIPHTLQYGLTIYTVGKVGQVLCLKTNCIERTWNLIYANRASELARSRVPIAGLLPYRTQPTPRVAGLLEYSEPEWKAALSRLKSWRPRSLSAQMLIAGLVGAAVSGGIYGYAQVGEVKFPPMALLRLTQVHRACDLSQALSELARSCSSPGKEGCLDPEAAKSNANKIIVESSVLNSSYRALENLDVQDLANDSADLLSRIPANHRGLFQNILKARGDSREALCKRLTLNAPATSQILQDGKIPH